MLKLKTHYASINYVDSGMSNSILTIPHFGENSHNLCLHLRRRLHQLFVT